MGKSDEFLDQLVADYYKKIETKQSLQKELGSTTTEIEQKFLPKGLYMDTLSGSEIALVHQWIKLDIPITRYIRFGRQGKWGMLLSNEELKKWSFAGYPFHSLMVFNYSDIVDVQAEEMFEQQVEGRVGSAAVGGLLFGAVGAIAGSAGSKNVEQLCKSMDIHFTLATLDCPSLTKPFLNAPISTKSFEYSEIKKDIQAIVGAFQAMKAQAKKVSETQPNPVIVTDFADAIEKLFALKEKGMITEEEYIAKKKQILGI